VGFYDAVGYLIRGGEANTLFEAWYWLLRLDSKFNRWSASLVREVPLEEAGLEAVRWCAC